MPENKPINSIADSQRARDIAKKWAGSQRREQKRQLSTLEKILLVGSIFAAATWGTIEALRPSQYDRIKNLPAAEYVVKTGDTFYALSERFIQDKDKYEKSTITHYVMELNSVTNPGKLRPGQAIMLPVEDMTQSEVRGLGGMLR